MSANMSGFATPRFGGELGLHVCILPSSIYEYNPLVLYTPPAPPTMLTPRMLLQCNTLNAVSITEVAPREFEPAPAPTST